MSDDAIDYGAMDEIRPGAWLDASQQMVVTDQVLAGHWFAHRITEHELVAGWLEVQPDFAPLGAFARRYDTPEGGEVRLVEPGGDERVPPTKSGPVLLGPEGWLDGGFADAYVLLSVEGSTLNLRWEPRGPAAAPDAAAATGVFEALGQGAPVPLLDLVLHLLARSPELFGPASAPLSSLLDASGLVATGGEVARVGHDGEPVPVRTTGLPGLRLDSSRHAQRLLQSVVDTRDRPGEPTDGAVLAALADGDAVSAMAEQVVGGGLVAPEDLARWLDQVVAEGSGSVRSGVAFLRSRLAEWNGDLAGQESALASVTAARLPAARVDASWFASDRGDARSALALLRSAGVTADDPELRLVREFTVTGAHTVGRNEPCWCGSGRKHKHCCLRLNGHGLETRARWLHAKAVTFLQRPPQREAMLRIAVAHAGVAAVEDAPDRVVAAACDPTVTELCLFEGGIFERFVERRGALLPDDEHELAGSWASARHGLWHVADGSDVLRHHGTDREIELDALSAAKLPGPGVVLAVALPGPFALPGPLVSIPEDVVEEMSELVDAGSPNGLAARLGAEFGWTASPDLSSTRSRKAGVVAAAR